MNPFARRLTLSPRDRRTVSAGALAVALILMGGRGLPAWRVWRARVMETAGHEQAALASTQALLGAAQAVHDSLASRARRLDGLRALFLSGETPGAQGAELAARITQAAESTHVTMGALGIHTSNASSGDVSASLAAPTGARGDASPSDGRDPLVTVTVQGSATGDIQGVAMFLALLELGRPAVAVRAVTLTQPDVGAPRDRAESLQVEFLVEGLGAPRAVHAPDEAGERGVAP